MISDILVRKGLPAGYDLCFAKDVFVTKDGKRLFKLLPEKRTVVSLEALRYSCYGGDRSLVSYIQDLTYRVFICQHTVQIF